MLIESEPEVVTNGKASFKFSNVGEASFPPRAIDQFRLP